ncbi:MULTISPECIES: hypothetical protein [Luteimonas]|uniref:hypothetical protein n=1 Tax=Luteimonas TaxID=83614 RepID=UPI00117E69E6|nr:MULTISPECIES: hypothetical protein [Luteimonas]
MTRFRVAVAISALLLAPAALTAFAQAPQASGDAATPAETRVANEEEALVCTRTRQTGSNRVTRLCRTAEEARVERRAAEEAMRRKKSQPVPDIQI